MNFLERLANQRALENLSVTTTPYQSSSGHIGVGQSAPALGSTWYESPDVFFQGGQAQFPLYGTGGRRGDLSIPTPIPDWATASFDDPESFYQWYRASYQHPDFPAEQASLASASAAHREQERGTAAGIRQLEGSQSAIRGFLDRFRTDPDRAAIEESLRGHAAPGARMVSETEESAWQQRLAQAAARAEEARRVRAGATGALGGGASAYSRGAYQTLADAQGLQLSAEIERANEQARRRGVGELAGYTGSSDAFENRLVMELAAIDQEIARIKAGKEVEPTDFMPYSELAFSRQAYDEDQAFREREWAHYEEQAKWGIEDWFDVGLRAIGTGIYD